MLTVSKRGIMEVVTVAICLIVAAAAFLSLAVGIAEAQPPGDSKVQFYVFSSSNCADCDFLDHELLPSLKKQYGPNLEYKYYDLAPEVTDIKAYKFMINLEDSFGRTELNLPQVYIGDHALIGPEDVADQLPGLVAQYASQGGVPYPVLEINGAVIEPPSTTPIKPSDGTPTEQPAPTGSPVYVAYFYKNACRDCDPVAIELEYLKSFGGNVTVRTYDLGTRRGIEMNAAMCLAYGVPKEKRGIAPSLFVGSHYLYGKDLNRKELNAAIDAERKTAPPNVPWQAAEQFKAQAKQELQSTFNTFTVFTVMGAGLVDGLNPCAFTVIVFLVAYLAFIGKTGKETLYVGLAMAATAFLTYLLLGFGLLSFVNAVSRSGTAGTWITAIVASLTAVFGIVAISDFVRTKATGKESKTLGMSKTMTQRIHAAIREHTKTSYLVLGAVVLGILVTLFEFGCTGQVYLPVITFVARSGDSTFKAIVYLVLFCLMSTLPLIIVFLLAYFGTSSKKISEFGRKHAAVLTLVGGIVMLALSVVLFLTL